MVYHAQSIFFFYAGGVKPNRCKSSNRSKEHGTSIEMNMYVYYIYIIIYIHMYPSTHADAYRCTHCCTESGQQCLAEVWRAASWFQKAFQGRGQVPGQCWMPLVLESRWKMGDPVVDPSYPCFETKVFHMVLDFFAWSPSPPKAITQLWWASLQHTGASGGGSWAVHRRQPTWLRRSKNSKASNLGKVGDNKIWL